MKRLTMLCAALMGAFTLSTTVFASDNDFSDVPKEHWAYEDIHAMRRLGLTDGLGNNMYGMGKTLSRAEFVTFLVNLMGWDTGLPGNGTFADNGDEKTWYYTFIETAQRNGATDVVSGQFRPNAPITREEMAVTLVKALGYDELAGRLADPENPFDDVTQNAAYISISKDIGIIAGVGDNRFDPAATATREQAAAMLMRLFGRLNNDIETLNAFYAIKSASQMELIPRLNSVSFGWSRMELDGGRAVLNTTSANNNEYNMPDGFEDPLGIANQNSVKALLMVAVQEEWLPDGQLLAAKLVTDEALRAQVVDAISGALGRFDGVVVDFEGLKGEQAKAGLNAMLKALRERLGGKLMAVAVQPQRRAGLAYFDGYDYRTIGELADKVILMAHDYNAKRLTPDEMAQGIVVTPLAPVEEVYVALKAITDAQTGVADKSKIMLQISFDTAQWKTVDGAVVNETPFRPDYNTLQSRIDTGVGVQYDTRYESPYITFTNADDGTDNVIWFENGQSVAAKIRLAKLFGVKGVSVWRLGNMPDDGWNAIKIGG